MCEISKRLKSLYVLITLSLIVSIKSDNYRPNDNPELDIVNFRENYNFIDNPVESSTKVGNSYSSVSNRKNNNTNGNQENNNNNNNHERVLSRQKRYLIFPEGSSLQVVFDQIIPIVDYNNYLILGITVALAWELPSKRPSEIFEDVKEKLNDGTLGIRKDENIGNLQYLEEPNHKLPYSNYEYNEHSIYENGKYNPNRRIFSKLNENPYYSASKYYPSKSYNYYNKIPTNIYSEGGPVYYNNTDWIKYPKINMENSNSYVKENINWNRNTGWDTVKRISNTLKRRPIHSGNGGGYQTNGARKHRIYPVFGKRSTDSHRLTEEEKFHLRYHRSSRHGLYFKIEKYLHTQGKNGLDCVMKTLCETGQRRHEQEPDTFVREIMRAIFTIPKSIDPVTDRKHRMYDEAHSHKGNCSEEYPLCPGSIWSSDFLF